ncbi:MAG: phosphatase PAP2 family protein [Legionellales bacterium]|nr:phosphatase PAP2 family protein [Legionellales bacterium]
MFKFHFVKQLFIALILFFYSCFSYSKSFYTQYGDIGQIAIPTIACGISIFKKDWQGVKQFFQATRSTLVVVYATKCAVNAKRPLGGNYSFPSGHTAGAFSGAAYLHKQYGFKNSSPAYIAAIFVGHSRVVAKAHWVRDVIGASIITVGINHFLVSSYNKLDLGFIPKLSSKGGVITAKYKLA